MRPAKLEGEPRAAALASLLAAGWTEAEDRDALIKRFVFRDFSEAFGWMTRVAMVAETSVACVLLCIQTQPSPSHSPAPSPRPTAAWPDVVRSGGPAVSRVPCTL